MNKIFLDSDIVIDFLTGRAPFSETILKIINASTKTSIQLHVSSLTFNNVYYIISNVESKNRAKKKIEKLNKLVKVLNVGQKVIDLAIQSKFKDFEDAIQNFCASESGIEILITRNVKDYKESKLSVLTPVEYLVQIEDKDIL